jgi:hypothetical protein
MPTIPTTTSRPLVKVILERALIVRGGDIGAAEIYFEGWVDDSAGCRRGFRIPHAGAIPGVKDGQTIPLDTVIYESVTPVGAHLKIHIEAWDEDLGRDSLINPDDLLGAYDANFDSATGWGTGRHENLALESTQGAWQLSYRIETRAPIDAADNDAELGATD